MPALVVRVDLDRPLPERIDGAERYERVWVVAFRSGVPAGRVLIENERKPLLTEHLRTEIVRQLPAPKRLAAVVAAAGTTHALSVVVCTRNRPQDLEVCLRHLTALDPGRHRVEIVVVDNDPASEQSGEVVRRFAGVRYEGEPRPGVAYARNCGLRSATGDIVAFVDDDVVVPPEWPSRILAPFADERVMCVSGLVLPLELETESQELYEEYGALGRGYVPRSFDAEFFHRSRWHCVHTWELGGTANVAIRKSVLSRTGLFDETLGPGLPTGVGEDIYMFYRLLRTGQLCRYEPAAYVWHRHRREWSALRRQLYAYSKGQTAYQMRTLISDGDLRVLFQLFVNLPLWHVARMLRILRGRKPYPLRLVAWEILGNLVGPLALLRSMHMHRALNGPGANPIGPSAAAALAPGAQRN